MLNTCNVSGTVYTPDGRLARNCRVSFLLAHRRVMPQADMTIVPMRVEAGTDSDGTLFWTDEEGAVFTHVPLAPGGYEAHIFDPEGAPFPPVNLGVLDEDSAEFSALIDAPPPVVVVQGPKGDPGDDGLSTYEVALDNGFVGTESEWLASLAGPPGTDGNDGLDGAPGTDGLDGASAYEIAVANGFVGTEAEWLDSLKGEGADPAEFEALRDEVVAARGSRTSLGLRISTISDFACPNAGQALPGRYVDQSFHGTAANNYTPGQRRLEISPFYTSQSLLVDHIGFLVQSGSAGFIGRAYIYSATPEGWPNALLYEGPDLDLSASGFVGADLAAPFSFETGRTYWLGFRNVDVGGAQLRAVPTSNCVNLGLLGPDSNQYVTILRRSLTAAAAAPDPWAFVESDMVGNVTPVSFRMRVAS
ncbi:hypothetical protein [Paracoccus sp. MKU1]|uniref:hypothetical protein n=1 Tax=Paracoccus sp. MKU1 TaxID=1745182 RepID=UPI0007EF2495|nr:hypothetical protein [Paracoccus sp. MKU1]